MGKLNQNIEMWKGNYQEISFYIEDVSSVESCSAEWACAVDANSAALITKSTTGSTITLSGKTVTVILSPSDTSGMTAGTYYHELRLVDASSHPSTPAIGSLKLNEVVLDGS